VLTSPALICIIIGLLLFLIGLLDAVGALVCVDNSKWVWHKLVYMCLCLFPVVCAAYFYHTVG